MKAFVAYNKNVVELRKLCTKLQNYGKLNCTFEQFVEIYEKWHLCTFKGCPVSYNTATFREDWFASFIMYLANYEI